MNISLPLPEDTSEPSEAGELARQLAQILGPAYAAVTSNLVAADLLAYGDFLKDLQDALTSAINEAFVNTAEQLLDEHEQSYGLAVRSDLTTDERRQRLLTKVRSARGGSPLSIKSAFIAYDNGTTVWEISTQDVAESWMAFVIAVQLPSASLTFTMWRELHEMLRATIPAHVLAATCQTVGFLTNDDDSLTNRDVLDA